MDKGIKKILRTVNKKFGLMGWFFLNIILNKSQIK